MASSRRPASSQGVAPPGSGSAFFTARPRDGGSAQAGRDAALAGPSARQPRRGREAEERVASMLACVRASGLKLTPQRMAIVRELAADPTHPTAQEIYERLRDALPTMSFATVYNTLDALAAAGLCAALALSPGAARFDPNMAAHHHAVCDRCGLVRDVPCEPAAAGRAGRAPAAAREASAPAPLAAVPGFEVRAVERIYRGLCAACAREAAGGRPPGPRGLGRQGAARPRGAPATPPPRAGAPARRAGRA